MNLIGTVRFEHRHLPYLNEDDYRAMLTGSYDISSAISSNDTVLDIGGNVGYIAAVAASHGGWMAISASP